MQNKTNSDLLEIIEKLTNIMVELLNENEEKENMINVLMTEFKDN